MTATEIPDDTGIVTKLSPRSVTDTVSRLTDLVAARGMKLFAVIDQSAEARQSGLELRETTLVMFGSPAAFARLPAWVAARGVKLFAVMDQSAGARQSGLELRETTLVMFGSPAAG